MPLPAYIYSYFLEPNASSHSSTSLSSSNVCPNIAVFSLCACCISISLAHLYHLLLTYAYWAPHPPTFFPTHTPLSLPLIFTHAPLSATPHYFDSFMTTPTPSSHIHLHSTLPCHFFFSVLHVVVMVAYAIMHVLTGTHGHPGDLGAEMCTLIVIQVRVLWGRQDTSREVPSLLHSWCVVFWPHISSTSC